MSTGTQPGKSHFHKTAEFNLSKSHAYTILDYVSHEGLDLIKIRNPWRSESYKGPYHDGDSRWTESLRQATGH